jgi:hypothetical protein
LVLVAGCGGGSAYTTETGQIAQRFLPTVRTVDHHPDSVRALTIAEDDETLQYQLDADFQALTQKWSCRFQNIGAGPPTRSRTYATFWSLELSLVSLQPETGLLSLQKKKARDLVAERRAEYHDTIQIDVFWFLGQGEDGIIAGPSARTELRVDEHTLRPVRTDHGPLREAFVAGGETTLYRRNTLHFPRTVDEADVLRDATGMQLQVRRTGATAREQFTWRWEAQP